MESWEKSRAELIAELRALHRKRVVQDEPEVDAAGRDLMASALMETEHRFRTLMNHLPGAVFIKDASGRLLFCNQVFAEAAGAPPEALIGKRTDPLISKETARRFAEENRQVLAEGTTLQHEHTYPGPDGETHWLTVKFPIAQTDGPPLLGGISLDITQRVRANRALANREVRLRSVLRAAPIGIGLIREGMLIDVNDALCAMLGYDAPALIGQSLTMLDPSAAGESEDPNTEFPLGSTKTRWQRKDGTVLDIRLNTVPLDAGDPDRGRTFTAMDITDRLRAQHALQESQRMLSTLMNNLPGMAYRCLNDRDWTMQFVSSGAVELTGYEPGQLTHENGESIAYASLIHPEDRTRVWEEIQAALEARRPFEVEYRLIAADGTEKYVWERGTGVYDDAGHLLHLEGFISDITERKRTEEAQRRIHQQERLATLGQFAAGVAHDFNNIMTTIILYAKMAARGANLTERGHRHLKTIEEQAQHASHLIQQILDFTRQRPAERRPLDLQPLVREHVKLLRRTLPESIRVVLHEEPDAYILNADPTGIQQLMMNLALNARDAMDEGGILTLALGAVTVGTSGAAPLREMTPGRWIKLTVSDTGSGIDSEVLPHIFEPFFTTKSRGAGSGLGLAQVQGIVIQHEGHIDVETDPDAGTTFTVYLPAGGEPEAAALGADLPTTEADRDQEPSEAAPTIPQRPVGPSVSNRNAPSAEGSIAEGNGELLLVVEDNPATRRAVVDSLRTLHYRVLTAVHGREALAKLDAAEEPIDLVLSDVVMPEMGGVELFLTLRAQYPDLPIILMSGHPMEEALESLRKRGLTRWLTKPTGLEPLARTIADELRSTHG